MRRFSQAGWLVLLGLLACARPVQQLPSDAGVSPAAEQGFPVRSVSAADVEAYLRYRRAAGPPPGPGSWKTLRDRSRTEERALQQAGLSEEGLEAVEPLVLGVLGQLQLVKVSQVEETLRTYEQIQTSLPADTQKTLEPAVTSLRARRERLQQMTALRQEYGNAAVDAVLRVQRELQAVGFP